MTTPDQTPDRDAGEPVLHAAMQQALQAAARWSGRGPNPRVGCVILDRSGQVVAEAWHRGAGTVHAEVEALTRAGTAAAGGTAVVTLEPCAHTGRTGPCTRALIEAGVTRVVFGSTDPNPAASGGADVLRASGIDVVEGLLLEQCEELNRRWLHAVRTGRPYLIWKFAATLDGRSAAADGTSRWITGALARADVHRRRGEVDAIMVGTGTVLADDPELTARTADGEGDPAGEQPLRVVVGRRDLPAAARVLAPAPSAPPTLHLRTRDLVAVMTTLYERDVRTVWLEGGPQLAAAFWRAGLIDEVCAYLAPALLGAGPPAVADLGITTIAAAARLHLLDVQRLGDDLLLTADVHGTGLE